MPESQVDIAAIRKKLAATQGKGYWRSLEELADTREFRQFLHREFSNNATEWLDSPSRRRFLKLMGASFALAGLTACGSDYPGSERALPYVRQPERIVPGKPLFYATAMSLSGIGLGVLVEQHMGRPTKVEGNEDHPGSLGSTDTYSQASILQMYDPDRSTVVTKQGNISTYGDFIEEFRSALDARRRGGGAGVRVLTETVTSPTLASQLDAMLTAFPNARWHQYEPAGRDGAREGSLLAYNTAADTVYNFTDADVIFGLDANFLSNTPANARYVHDFAARRRGGTELAEMNRFYQVESTPTNTGVKADHRLPVRASQIEAVARAVATRLGIQVGTGGEPPVEAGWIDALVSDLQVHRGRSIVLAGDNQPAAVHALAFAMNQRLGNVGSTVIHIEPLEARPVNQLASLRQLVTDMNAGRVQMLLIIGGNPVYTAPADIPFAQALSKVGLSAHLALYVNDTSQLTQWHVPEAHYLESWSDTRAYDGTISIVQPLIQPLYGGKTAHETLALFSETPDQESYDIVRGYYEAQARGNAAFEQFWRRALHNGVVAETARPRKQVQLRADFAQQLGPVRAQGEGLELIFQPDPSIFDGRFANNAWLQELPRPLTKLVWDNAAIVSPSLAERLDVRNDDVVRLTYKGRSLEAPIWIQPGHAPESVTLHLGYGQRFAGRVGNGTGVNAYTLRTSDAPWFGTGLQLNKTGGTYDLVSTQDHHGLEGRDHVRWVTFQGYLDNPDAIHDLEQGHHEADLYPDYKYNDNAWGMAVDMSTCVGCNACVIACQAENNIPVVGKDQVANGREMHWLRIDTYYTGQDLDNPETIYQPMFCQHCEKAPCEVVCPVYATVHDTEGLNVMVYNRCIGTRYCSNNCPYKVRRFNWLQYSDKTTLSLKSMRNPDVTVRERGVMEKCTYCVQRISHARINAEKEGRRIREGELRMACQAACPANALVFGDINDEESEVFRLKAEMRNYSVLGSLNTKPRTTYLATLLNPNAELVTSEERATVPPSGGEG